MSASEIDEYLNGVPAPQRAVLKQLRTIIMKLEPDVEERFSYRVPAFRVAGGIVRDFASFKNHMSYLPFSGSGLDQRSPEVDCYSRSKSALRFTPETPLPDELVEQLIRVRLSEVRSHKR